MGTLTRSSTAWTGTIDQTSISKTYSFPTSGKYVDKDIALTVNVNDPNLIPENIKKDITILGTTGTLEGDVGGGSGGAYNAESIILDDGTQKIRIVDAEGGGGGTPEPVGGMRMDSSFLGNTFKFYPRLNLLFDRIQLPDQVEPIYEIVILEE